MLLLTNPNDPLGVVYQPHVISDAISWARSHNIHTVVDEIFALTVHKVSIFFILCEFSFSRIFLTTGRMPYLL